MLGTLGQLIAVGGLTGSRQVFTGSAKNTTLAVNTDRVELLPVESDTDPAACVIQDLPVTADLGAMGLDSNGTEIDGPFSQG